MSESAVIVGIDLAWGLKQPDGVALLRVNEANEITEASIQLTRGDEALLDLLEASTTPRKIVALDAPVICINESGSRPVDRLTHQRFGRFHAGCHPVNQRLAPRPIALAKLLTAKGLVAHWDLDRHQQVLIEVYPHPAMIRWFELERIIKYKRGLVNEKRAEYRRYQSHFTQFLTEHCAALLSMDCVQHALKEGWTKANEDQLDALFCAVIAWWHWKYRGERSEILGDAETGFLVVPRLK